VDAPRVGVVVHAVRHVVVDLEDVPLHQRHVHLAPPVDDHHKLHVAVVAGVGHDERDVDAVPVLHPPAAVGVLQDLAFGVHARELQPDHVAHGVLYAEVPAQQLVQDGLNQAFVLIEPGELEHQLPGVVGEDQNRAVHPRLELVHVRLATAERRVVLLRRLGAKIGCALQLRAQRRDVHAHVLDEQVGVLVGRQHVLLAQVDPGHARGREELGRATARVDADGRLARARS